MLQMDMGQMGKARFHFEHFWPKFDDYGDTIAQVWKRPNEHDPVARLDLMLQSLVRDLKRWSASRVREIKAQLLMARELMLRLDAMQERHQLFDAEAGLKKRLKMRCLGLSSLERTMAR